MKRAIVIGGGIIGLSSAYYLRKAGWDVAILDRHSGKEGASYGNAGYIGPSHYTPLANPKAFKNALKWMLSPTSPFYVHPSLSLSLIDWGMKFMANATLQHVRDSARPLIDIALLSQKLYEEWHAEFLPFPYEKKGLIEVYQTEASFLSAAAHAKSSCSNYGLEMEAINRSDLERLEPEVTMNVAGGVHVLTDAHTYPPRLMATLLEQLRQMDVKMIAAEATSFTTSGGRIVEVQTPERPYEADLFVLAAGAWSRELGRSAGIEVPMVAGRGYSITYPHTVCPLRHPLYLGEASVAVTPMDGDKVRIGGTMEIVPKGTPPRMARVRGILESAHRFLPQNRFPNARPEDVWYGYRPCSADGLPYIGRSLERKNLIVATGHSMLGLSLGPATGKLVTEIAEEAPHSVGLAPFDPNRF